MPSKTRQDVLGRVNTAARVNRLSPTNGQLRPGIVAGGLERIGKGIRLVTSAATRINPFRQAPVVQPGSQKRPDPAMSPAGLPFGLAQRVGNNSQASFLSIDVRYYTPDLVLSLLRQAYYGDVWSGWQIAHLMEDTWPKYVSNLLQVKRAAANMRWTVEPYVAEGADKPTPEAVRRAQVVKTCLFGMRPAPGDDASGLHQTIVDLLDAWGKGVSVLEIDWEPRRDPVVGSVIAPKQTRWIHCQYWGYDVLNGRFALRVGAPSLYVAQPVPGEGAFEPFAPNKFLVSVVKARSGAATGGALFRPLAPYWVAANFCHTWLLNAAQIFGLPFRKATYQQGMESLIPQIQAMMEQMGSSAWGVFPEGTLIEFLEGMKSGEGNPAVYMREFCDRQCDLMVLGQTLTSAPEKGGGGSHALGKVHEGVLDEIKISAAKHACAVINEQLVAAILNVNFGNDDQPPRVMVETKRDDDPLAKAQTFQILLSSGFQLPRKWANKAFEIPEPEPGEDLITGAASPMGAGPAGKTGMHPEGNPDAQGDETEGDETEARKAIRSARSNPVFAMAAQDKLIERMLEDISGIEARWLAPAKPWFREMIRAAENPHMTDEQFIRLLESKSQRVPEEVGRLLDDGAVARALEGYMGASVLNGALAGAATRSLPLPAANQEGA